MRSRHLSVAFPVLAVVALLLAVGTLILAARDDGSEARRAAFGSVDSRAPADSPPTRSASTDSRTSAIDDLPERDSRERLAVKLTRSPSMQGALDRDTWHRAGLPSDHPALVGVEGEWLPANLGPVHQTDPGAYRVGEMTAGLPAVVFEELARAGGGRSRDELREYVEEQNLRVRELNDALASHADEIRRLLEAGDRDGADALERRLIEERFR